VPVKPFIRYQLCQDRRRRCGRHRHRYCKLLPPPPTPPFDGVGLVLHADAGCSSQRWWYGWSCARAHAFIPFITILNWVPTVATTSHRLPGTPSTYVTDGYVAALLLRSHLYLCICFGLAQGATITSITYATTFMGETVGSYCDGVFFGSFTIVSLTIGAPLAPYYATPRHVTARLYSSISMSALFQTHRPPTARL
jgi:hypothetical protein